MNPVSPAIPSSSSQTSSPPTKKQRTELPSPALPIQAEQRDLEHTFTQMPHQTKTSSKAEQVSQRITSSQSFPSPTGPSIATRVSESKSRIPSTSPGELVRAKVIRNEQFNFKSLLGSVDVDQADFVTTPINTKAIFTTGVATCLGIIAKAYRGNECIRIGLLHQDSTGENGDNFLYEMATSDKGVTGIRIWIYGGYESKAEDNEEYQLFQEEIEGLKKTLPHSISVTIHETQCNPWGITSTYQQHEQMLDKIGFSLSVGITPKGEIIVSDDSDLSTLPEGSRFLKNSDPFKKHFLQYSDPVVQKFLTGGEELESSLE